MVSLTDGGYAGRRQAGKRASTERFAGEQSGSFMLGESSFAPSGLDLFWADYTGRRSRTRFALGYCPSGFQPFQFEPRYLGCYCGKRISSGFDTVGRRRFPQGIRVHRAGRGRGAEGKCMFPQGTEHPQFLRDGPGGQVATQGAFAGEDFFQTKLMASGIVARIAASGQQGHVA